MIATSLPTTPFEDRPELGAIEREIPRILGLLKRDSKQTIILISCGKRKLDRSARADELYTSPRSRLAVGLTSILRYPFRIVSAAHGLLRPDQIVSPYDVSLDGLTSDELTEWRAKVAKDLASFPIHVCRFLLLGSDDYIHQISIVLTEIGADYIAPMTGCPANQQTAWLKKAARSASRARDIATLYEGLYEAMPDGSTPSLREVVRGSVIPDKGVYVFLDPDESSVISDRPRIVRIGTHAVSEGSRATLRTRLRTHLGTEAGTGSHRSSVFRQHVGAALLRRDPSLGMVASWGASKTYTADMIATERRLEEEVSKYIGRLLLAIIPLSDSASKFSMRRIVEKNLISLFTEDGIMLDPASDDWLGRYSAHSTIRATGLWNVNDAFSKYDPRSMSLIRWN